MHQWSADIELDAALAERLIAAQFPALAGGMIVPFGIGWDNAAFLVDERVVFRFPRRRAVAALLEREAALLPLVAAALPLPISAPSYIGAPSTDFPWVWAGYTLIVGRTADSVSLNDSARHVLADPLGAFLRALHAVDTAPLVARGLPGDEIGLLDHARRMPLSHKRVAFLAEQGLLEDGDAWLAYLEAHAPEPPENAALRFVHGDLYARHVLFHEGIVAGIIDWGDTHLGDPAIDLAIAHSLLPSTAHASFRRAYGPIDERTWTTARYRAIYHALLELEYGVHENDAGMRESGLTALRLMRT